MNFRHGYCIKTPDGSLYARSFRLHEDSCLNNFARTYWKDYIAKGWPPPAPSPERIKEWGYSVVKATEYETLEGWRGE